VEVELAEDHKDGGFDRSEFFLEESGEFDGEGFESAEEDGRGAVLFALYFA